MGAAKPVHINYCTHALESKSLYCYRVFIFLYKKTAFKESYLCLHVGDIFPAHYLLNWLQSVFYKQLHRHLSCQSHQSMILALQNPVINSQPSLTWSTWSSVHLERLFSQGSQDPILSWDSIYVSDAPFKFLYFFLFLSLSSRHTATLKSMSLELWVPIYTVQAWKSNHNDIVTTQAVMRLGFESPGLYIQSSSSVSLLGCLISHKSNLKLPTSTSKPHIDPWLPLRPPCLSDGSSIDPVDWVKNLSFCNCCLFSWAKNQSVKKKKKKKISAWSLARFLTSVNPFLYCPGGIVV